MSTREFLAERYGEELLFMDGYDSCIAGVIFRFGQEYPLVCYDFDQVIQTNIDMGMTEEEALEWYEYNQIGAWVGENTPCFLKRIENE